jgi:N-acetylglucosaminyl-diphospho-decaprenol L-rhamnosyltransferase
MASVAIIVVTYNSEACVGDLLASLEDIGADAVVVVDNGSSDGTVAVVEGFKGVQLVRSTNIGYAGGINLGIRGAPDADAYLILNPDLSVRPGLLAALTAALTDPHVGLVVPRVLHSDGRRQNSLRREPTLLRAIGFNWTGVPALSEYVSGEDDYRTPRDVDWALGAAIMLRRECYESVGPWDETFFLYSEETDFCLRARDAGWTTRFVPDGVVVHHEGGSGRTAATHQMLILNKVRLYARRHSNAASWVYWGVTLLSEASWVLRGHPESRASIRALLRPQSRPYELGLGRGLVPR